ncbi:MAG: nucleotidyltransferase domain-containing protein [Clostridia bacterium]|nr:nucleotidyltransferase domain-containing protein [Clostridia bacterium]
MIDIESWMKIFLQALQDTFGDRVEFVGLQGSYARGEATETSDIDVVVIFDELHVEDIVQYNDMLDKLPNRDFICGFISGKQELLHWESSDLFQFYFDTRPIKGSLTELQRLLDHDAVNRAVKLGACNIYHACVHNMLHGKSEEVLKALYKSAVFTIQALYYQKKGEYVSTQNELLKAVDKEHREIVRISIDLKNGIDVAFQEMCEKLFTWAKKLISA